MKRVNEAFSADPTSGGFTPDLSEWISNQEYVGRNLIAVVTRNVATDQEDDEHFGIALKTILEVHPVSIDGFWTGFASHGIYTPDAHFRVIEKYGRPVDRFLMKWRYLYDCYKNLIYRGPDREQPTLEEATIDMMFIEPDPTHTVVAAAWEGFEMYPLEYKGIQSKRDVRIARTLPSSFRGLRLRNRAKPTICDFSLEADHFEVGEKTLAKAQAILNGINLQSSDPHERTDFVNNIVRFANPDWQPETVTDPASLNLKKE
jgi:hypothetical protein